MVYDERERERANLYNGVCMGVCLVLYCVALCCCGYRMSEGVVSCAVVKIAYARTREGGSVGIEGVQARDLPRVMGTLHWMGGGR